jgi:F-type H+-transporting ATPase subunit b
VTLRIAARMALVAIFALLGSSFAFAAPVEGHGENGTQGHGDAAAEHGAEHVPSFHDINWYHGLLFESEGAEPSLLVRPKGMPVPFLGYVLNALVLYTLIYRFAKKPIRDGLAKRKARIEGGMKEAAAHRADAQARLESYKQKLASIEEEVERVRRDMRAAGEAERARVIAEAHARRERMERDAKLLVEQEFVAMRERLTKEMIESALRSASTELEARVTPQDHARLADEYLARLPNVRGVSQSGSAT